MTKKDLADAVVLKTGIRENLARKTVQAVFDCIFEALVRGETLEFRNLGVFKTKPRKARIGRNPKTGTVVQVPERKVIAWKMGKALKEAIWKR